MSVRQHVPAEQPGPIGMVPHPPLITRPLLLLAALFGTVVAAVAAGPDVATTTPATAPEDAVVVVRWLAPVGTRVELLTPSGWVEETVPFQIGLQVGQTYVFRCHVTVAGEPTVVCPTIQVLRPVHVPPEVDPWEFPVTVALSDADLALVREEMLVTKVVTLERPDQAIPIAYPPDEMPEIDARVGVDPLLLAETMGMPVLIMRVGTRVYERQDADWLPKPPVVHRGHVRPTRAPEQRSLRPPSGLKQASFDAVERLSMPSAFPVPHPWASAPARGVDPSVFRPLKLDYSYVCDGDDRAPRAGRDAAGVTHGLEPSETVGFYSTENRLRSVPAAPVCVYAPRYIAIRGATRRAVGRLSLATATVLRTEGRRQLESRKLAAVARRRSDVALERGEKRPAIARQRYVTSAISRVDFLHATRTAHGIARIVLDIASGELVAGQEAWLTARIQAARVWQFERRPAYTALTAQNGILQGYARPEMAVKVDEPPRSPGEIVMWKVADKAVAHPGDIVEFAIYYKNVGEQPVHSLSIMDSLVPRLEYIEKSSGSTRNAVFTVGPNKAGSTVLRWDIPGEIKPGEQGAVWFKARVR